VSRCGLPCKGNRARQERRCVCVCARVGVRVSWVEAGAGEFWLENWMDKIKVAGGIKRRERRLVACCLYVYV
jgi:hypothetical protein